MLIFHLSCSLSSLTSQLKHQQQSGACLPERSFLGTLSNRIPILHIMKQISIHFGDLLPDLTVYLCPFWNACPTPTPRGWAESILFPPFSPLSAAAAAAKLLQSCPTLCDPIDGSPSGSTVPEILQARTLEWLPLPSPVSSTAQTMGQVNEGASQCHLLSGGGLGRDKRPGKTLVSTICQCHAPRSYAF